MPRLRIEFVQILSDVINDLAGAAQPGGDQAVRRGPRRARGVRASSSSRSSSKVDGLEDFFNGVSEPSAELDDVDQRGGGESRRAHAGAGRRRSRAARCSACRPARCGCDDRSIGVRVRAPDSVRFDPRCSARSRSFRRRRTRPVPLGALATFAAGGDARRAAARESAADDRDDGRRERIASLGAVMNDVKAVLAANPPPRGHSRRARRAVREPAGGVSRAAARARAGRRRA